MLRRWQTYGSMRRKKISHASNGLAPTLTSEALAWMTLWRLAPCPKAWWARHQRARWEVADLEWTVDGIQCEAVDADLGLKHPCRLLV